MVKIMVRAAKVKDRAVFFPSYAPQYRYKRGMAESAGSRKIKPKEGFEPSTPALRKRCSAIELLRRGASPYGCSASGANRAWAKDIAGRGDFKRVGIARTVGRGGRRSNDRTHQ